MSVGVCSSRLRQAREYLGLDVFDAAAASGLQPEELEAVEFGQLEADDLMLQRVGRAYGLRTSYFTASDDDLQAEAIVVLGRLAGELTGHDRDEALRFAAYLHHALDD